MYNIYTNNANCPYCLDAKILLTQHDKKYTYNIVSKTTLNGMFPEATTVPQITSNDKYIGGYDDLYHVLTPRTVFNAENTGHITGKYPLLFGPDLGFVDTINTPYPILDELFQQQLSQIWNEFEIDLTQDRQDMLTVPPEKLEPMVLNLLWQTIIDGVANRSITGLLLEFISNSDLEAWYNIVAFFETIHARTYIHIIKQTFVDPNDALKKGYANKHILNRAKSIIDAFDKVANLPDSATLSEKKEAVYLALVALYMLESVNFMSSFGVTFGIAETGVFQGISQDVTLICRDEILHARGGKAILSIQMKEDSFMLTLKDKIQALFDNIISEEREWNSYLFSEGRQYIGGNAQILNEYVDWLSKPVAELLGLREVSAPKDIPLKYMLDYTNTSRVQVAAQEIQLTSYLVNAVSASTEEEIEEVLAEFR